MTATVAHTNKDTLRLDDQLIGANPDELLSVYADTTGGPWEADALPRLCAMAAEPGGLARLAAAGVSARRMRDALTGRSRPLVDARAALVALIDSTEPPSGRSCGGCVASLRGVDPRQKHCSSRCRKRAARSRAVCPTLERAEGDGVIVC
jgi:hypothetical protein